MTDEKLKAHEAEDIKKISRYLGLYPWMSHANDDLLLSIVADTSGEWPYEARKAAQWLLEEAEAAADDPSRYIV